MSMARLKLFCDLACFTLLAFTFGSPVRCPAQTPSRVEPSDWFAGDAHVHSGIGCGRSNEKEMLSPQQLLEMMKVNNLAVVSVLADAGNGEIKYADQQLLQITGHDNPASTPQRIVHYDAEWHYDPEGVTFERKVIGGHLILLGLKQGGQPYAEYTSPDLRLGQEARRHRRICAHAIPAFRFLSAPRRHPPVARLLRAA